MMAIYADVRGAPDWRPVGRQLHSPLEPLRHSHRRQHGLCRTAELQHPARALGRELPKIR